MVSQRSCCHFCLSPFRVQCRKRLQQLSGAPQTVDYRYSVVLNGVAAWINRNEAKRIARLFGVAFVQPEWLYQLLTDAGPEWIGALDFTPIVPGNPAGPLETNGQERYSRGGGLEDQFSL